MIILFRVDTGIIIGTGHLMRCLNLAKKLAKRYDNCKIIWATTEHPNNLIARIPESDYIIRLKPEKGHIMTDDTFTWLGSVENDVKQMVSGLNHIIEYDIKRIDLLIVDHYGIDYRWESKCLGSMELSDIEIGKILVIDDLANRDHICDYLIDTTYQVDISKKNENEKEKLNKYHKNQLISIETITLLGSKYVMLNPAFYTTDSNSINPLIRRDTYHSKFRVSISFGGADIPNMTGRVLESILREYHTISNITIDIILGGLNQHKDDIINLINNYHNNHHNNIESNNHNNHNNHHNHIESNNSPVNINLYQNLSYQDLMTLLEETHLNIGAGGVTLYERCYLGIPSIVITLAENQVENATNMAEDEIITYLNGEKDNWKHEELIDAIKKYREDEEYWKESSQRCKSIVDDQGCNRIISALDLFLDF
ncbi:MAG: UDP-2,4-diacetamido-2,4,6-trideoxy-beta-L-altropyranose hydrolase [Candidatus Paceibacterota bacterium]